MARIFTGTTVLFILYHTRKNVYLSVLPWRMTRLISELMCWQLDSSNVNFSLLWLSHRWGETPELCEQLVPHQSFTQRLWHPLTSLSELIFFSCGKMIIFIIMFMFVSWVWSVEVVVGFFCVWVERKFLGLGSAGKKILCLGLCSWVLWSGFEFLFSSCSS